MRIIPVATLLILMISCKSSHKLTGTDYVDLSTGNEAIINSQFPAEIVIDQGWGDLSSDTLDNIKEEVRILLISEFEPHQLFRIYKEKKKIKGESILYWRNKKAIEKQYVHERMNQYLKGKCEEYFETENYGYCKPGYIDDPDWGKLYSNLEARNIWQIPDQSKLEIETLPDTNIWVMNTQVRLGSYFRSYTQTSPEQYPEVAERTNILGILTQLQLVTNNESQQENFNVYSGITNGKKDSGFMLCDESEVWRFNASLEELILTSGYPVKVEEKEDQIFYVTVSGRVEDEWYSYRNNSGFLRVIQPQEINNLITLTKKECPSN